MRYDPVSFVCRYADGVIVMFSSLIDAVNRCIENLSVDTYLQVDISVNNVQSMGMADYVLE